MRIHRHVKTISWILVVLCLISGIPTLSYADSNTPYRQGFIEGVLISKGENEVQIEEYDGTLHALYFKSNAAFAIDTLPVNLADFKPGMEIYATLEGRKVDYMESYSTAVPGYIPEGGKVRVGIVKNIDRNQIIIELYNGQKETYFTSPATIALKNRRKVPLSVLYEGDRVKLFFDEMDTSIISRMAIEGNSIIIKDLYRGKLTVVDDLEDQIGVSNLEVFENGEWEEVSGFESIPYSTDIPAYIGGQKISFNKLKYYKGSTLYMAVKDFFNQNKIEKMVVKNQYESTYSDKIDSINWYSEAFELDRSHKNLTFNEGTMVIRNGRLQDRYAIRSDADAFIVGDGRGNDLMADVVYIYNEEINNSNIGQNYLYEGRLDEITKNKVELRDFTVLDQNEWESFDDTKELYYNNDTDIYDLEDDEFIQPEDFYAKDYAVDEDSDYVRKHHLKDWHGYVYTDGDQIQCIIVQKKRDSLLKQRITNGTVEAGSLIEDTNVGWKVKIQNPKDWSRSKGQWMERSSSLPLYLEDAMIIKDGEMISPEQLKSNDRLYIVRKNMEAKVIIVK